MVDREGEERITFNNLKKVAAMLKLNLTDDQVQEAIQSIAGKGKQSISWEQFNAHLAKKLEKKSKWCIHLYDTILMNKSPTH